MLLFFRGSLALFLFLRYTIYRENFMKKVPPLLKDHPSFHENINNLAIALGKFCHTSSQCIGENIRCDDCMFAGLPKLDNTYSDIDLRRTTEIEEDVIKILELISKLTLPKD